MLSLSFTAIGSFFITCLILDTDGLVIIFLVEEPPEPFVIVNHIHIIKSHPSPRLRPHLFQTLGHTPILVHHDHFGTHKSPTVSSSYFNRSTISPACSTSSICERILPLRIFAKLTHQVNRIVGLHEVDKALGNQLAGKLLQKFTPVLFRPAPSKHRTPSLHP